MNNLFRNIRFYSHLIHEELLILSRNYIMLFYDNFLMGLFIMGIGISRTMGFFSLVQKESEKAKANIGDTKDEYKRY